MISPRVVHVSSPFEMILSFCHVVPLSFRSPNPVAKALCLSNVWTFRSAESCSVAEALVASQPGADHLCQAICVSEPGADAVESPFDRPELRTVVDAICRPEPVHSRL